ncbi:hypothetical protein ABEB36_012938 [Hypothenemus hampei]|uniref:GIY-YIG homing endonuclease n=1 Tax=Hypothenemus hampei TaxID=57062 RepID=A0ABD1E697_HYPHA
MLLIALWKLSRSDVVPDYKQSGIYCLTTPTKHKYIGRTFRKFETRFDEHKNEVKKFLKGKTLDVDNIKSSYSRFIIDQNMNFSETKFDILMKNNSKDIIDIIEKYYVSSNKDIYLLNIITSFPELNLYNEKINKILKITDEGNN